MRVAMETKPRLILSWALVVFFAMLAIVSGVAAGVSFARSSSGTQPAAPAAAPPGLPAPRSPDR
jgi:hypothetical protein